MKKSFIRVHSGFLKNKHLPFVFHKNHHKQIKSTPAKVKEAVFQILENFDINKKQTIFFDMFAGSGQIGIEAISRGYHTAYLLEQNTTICNVLKKWLLEHNITNYQIFNRNSYTLSNFGELNNLLLNNFDSWIIYFDPPYRDIFENNTGVEKIIDFLSTYASNQYYFKKCIVLIQVPSIKSPYFYHLTIKQKEFFLKFFEQCDKQYQYGSNQILLQFYN